MWSGHRGNNFLLITLKKFNVAQLAMFLTITALIPVLLHAMINHLNWESLEDRRNKASLHTFYKMFNNLTTIPYIQYVQLSTVTSIRYSHPFKLIPMLAKKNPLKYSFLSRTIPLWNQLPPRPCE